MGIKRLKYVSRFAHYLRPEDVAAIVAVSQRNNTARGITGAMATTGRLFYQVLEGPAAELDPLFARIAADPRHTDVVLLRSQEDVPGRLFPNWSMQQVNLEEATASRLEPLRELLTSVVELRARSDQMAETLERALSLEISGRG